eukprot:TRINITY_DN8199_c0_g1_i20.p1 TRINITY_DN8199_c0_g1~~TRINITY_DN8199_c0_g1_i20.p1  ORF type:complete len:650 (-),score=99.46 TRINITY_DN8199_c0_g1_i20:24-1973(-)
MLIGQKRKRSLSISESITQSKDLFNVARYTFATYQPFPITAITTDIKKDACGVARENGQIELWCISSWTMLLALPSYTGEMIRNLHFYQDTLLSTSLNGNIIAWNLNLLKPHVLSLTHTRKSCTTPEAAYGTATWWGTSSWRPATMAQHGYTVWRRKLCSKGCSRSRRVTWQCMVAKALSVVASKYRPLVIVGYSDSAVRVWDVATRQIVRRMALDTSGVYIWRLIEVSPTELASGDSKGQVTIWDSTNFIELAHFKEHRGDITALCSGPENSLYATGVDSKITAMSKIESKGWVYTSCIRGQSHDINALCLSGADTLISGGVTTDICVYPLVNGRFRESYGARTQTKLRHVPPFPVRSVVSLTESNEELLMQGDRELRLWQVPSLIEPPRLQVVIRKKGSGIYSSEVSPRGDYLCYSDVDGVVVYKLEKHIATKLQIPHIKNCQALLRFSSTVLYAASVDGCLSILELEHSDLSQYLLKDPDNGKKLSVRVAALSPSFEWLLFATSDYDVWAYSVDTKEIQWKVPYTGVPTCLKCFEDSKAFIVSDNNEILIYDLAHKVLDAWTKNKGRNLPINYLDRFNRVYDIVQINPHKYILYTHYTFIVLDTELPTPKYSRCTTSKAYAINLSLIHICRCRRIERCRSRWSPYH